MVPLVLAPACDRAVRRIKTDANIAEEGAHLTTAGRKVRDGGNPRRLARTEKSPDASLRVFEILSIPRGRRRGDTRQNALTHADTDCTMLTRMIYRQDSIAAPFTLV